MDQFPDRIVAIGLLTRRDLDLLGPAFDRAWPVEETRDFNALLSAIDDSDHKLSGVGSVAGADEMER